jgi:shikimate kinase
MELYKTREKYYTECADLTITLEDCPVSEARKIIIDNIEEFINEQHPG